MLVFAVGPPPGTAVYLVADIESTTDVQVIRERLLKVNSTLADWLKSFTLLERFYAARVKVMNNLVVIYAPGDRELDRLKQVAVDMTRTSFANDDLVVDRARRRYSAAVIELIDAYNGALPELIFQVVLAGSASLLVTVGNVVLQSGIVEKLRVEFGYDKKETSSDDAEWSGDDAAQPTYPEQRNE